MFGIRTKNNEPDPRVAQALDQLEIKYEVEGNGDYKIVFALDGERSQIGYIRSRTIEFADFELREILSLGLRSLGPFDARTCNILLEQNAQTKVGAWIVVNDEDDDHLAIFSAKVAADLEGEALLAVISAILATADQMEERLSGRDDF